MYPKDNIFNIYYNIGKRTPFQVKRSRTADEDFRYNQKGRTFMVERVESHGRYGKAYGYCMIDGVRNDEYMKQCYPDKGDEIPCSGCGEWTLVDVPGVDMNEIFPVHTKDELMQFGKYKGQTIADIYEKDPKYLFWLVDNDPYYKIDFPTLMGVNPNEKDTSEQFNKKVNEIFPKVKVEDTITFGKYRGFTYRAIFEKDPQYIYWFLQNTDLDIDKDSFIEMLKPR